MPRSSRPIAFDSRLRRFNSEAKMHYLEVPPAILKRLGGKFMVRVICEVPSAKLRFHCAIMPLGKGEACIFFSQEKVRITGLREGHKIRVQVSLDSSKYGMKLPEELAEMLKQDPVARRRFDRLSPGKQRNIIFHISSIKQEEKRLDRAVQVMRDLTSMPEGKEEISILLNPALKEGLVLMTPAEEAEFRARFHPLEALSRGGRKKSALKPSRQ